MARNVFFTHGTRNEQFLQQNLVEEYIKMFGMDVLYIPRQLIQKDNVFNEEVVSQFDDSYIIEAYLENFDGFQGGGDLLTKFGIRQTDEITMVISQQRFSDLISQFLLLDEDIEVGERPQEGDLIYFPLSSNYFEIKFVEHEAVFYQTGRLQTYDLRCELFTYSNERIDTGISEIDAIEDNLSTDILTFEISLEDGGGYGAGILQSEDGGSIMQEYRVEDNQPTANNEYFQSNDPIFSSSAVIDFSESNPFSEVDRF